MEISTKNISVLKAWSKDDRCFATEHTEMMQLRIGTKYDNSVYIEYDDGLELKDAVITRSLELQMGFEKELDNGITLFITVVLEDECDVLPFIYHDLLHLERLCELVIDE